MDAQEIVLKATNAKQLQEAADRFDLGVQVIRYGKGWALSERGNVYATGRFDYIRERLARRANAHAA